jgi:hypothetical protein
LEFKALRVDKLSHLVISLGHQYLSQCATFSPFKAAYRMHLPTLKDDMASPNALGATDGQLSKLTSSLLESLRKGDTQSIESPLEQIYHYFREKTWKQSPSEALLQTWSACGLLLDEDLGPEVSSRPDFRWTILRFRRLISFLNYRIIRSRCNYWFDQSRLHF